MLAGITSLARNVPKLFRGTRAVGIAASPPPPIKFSKKTLEALNKIHKEKAADADFAAKKAYSAKSRSDWTDLKEFITGKFITKESPVTFRQTVEAGRKNPKYTGGEGPYPRGAGSSYYRGTTLKPEVKIISKQPEMKTAKAGPGEFFSTEPTDALTYMMNREGILTEMGILDNPGVIRKMPIKDAKVIKNARVQIEQWKTLANAADAPISMVMSVVGRLQKMGWSDAKIFRYIARIIKSGEKWKLFNSGGIVSLVL